MFRQKAIQDKAKHKTKRTHSEEKERLRNKERNRKRKHTVAFRMTEDEVNLLDEKVKLSGRLKQEYLTEAVLNHKVIFVGDRQVFNTMIENLERIEKQLKSIEIISQVDENNISILKTIIEMIDSIYEKEKDLK